MHKKRKVGKKGRRKGGRSRGRSRPWVVHFGLEKWNLTRETVVPSDPPWAKLC